MEKRIICIGYEMPGHPDLFHRYSSNQSLLDADIIVFQPDIGGYPLDHDTGSPYFQGKRCLSKDSSFNLKEHTSHWKKELSTALEHGKTIFVFFSEFEEVFVHTGKNTVSGTGRNAKVTNIVESFNNYTFFPAKLPPIIPKSGNGITFTGNTTFSTFFEEFKDDLVYKSYLNEKLPEAFFLTRTGEKTIGSLFKIGRGNLVLLPPISYDDTVFLKKNTNGQSLWTTEAIKFGKRLVKHLVEIDKVLRKSGERTPPPGWVSADEFKLLEEQTLSTRIEEITAKIDNLLTEKNQLLIELNEAVKLKDLVFEKGKNLENAIIYSLTILGYKAENYSDGTLELDQIIVSPEGDRFIGEAEGKDTTAINIDKFRQLSLNIHEDAQREEIEEPAIGILFGNGFRLLEPAKREEQFTTKCITVAKTSNCILIRTINLFEISKYVLESKDTVFAKNCRDAIKNSIGKIVDFPKVPIPLT